MLSAASRCRRFAALLMGLALLSLPVQAQNPGFIEQVTDLPLMPGLSELRGAGVVFDKPDGRIVEAYAEGGVDREAVLDFYYNTLPELGTTVL